MKKAFSISFVIAIFLIGCSSVNQPQPKVILKKEKGSKKIIYQYEPDDNIKQAVVILINKQRAFDQSLIKLNREIQDFKKQFKADNKKNKLCIKTSQKITNYKCNNKNINKFFWIAKKNVNIRCCPTMESAVIGEVKKGSIVKFKYCNSYCWCKLENDKGWVAKFLFKQKEKNEK